MNLIKIFVLLLMGHALADYGLQTPWMAEYKNRKNKPSLPPGQTRVTVWPYYLTAHAMINGLVVYMITGSMMLGFLETVSHWILDYLKTGNYTNPHLDQLGHVLMKIIIAGAWSKGI